jgi:5-methylcytosine-specific restriction protein A
MAWDNSDRRSRLPGNWQTLRLRVLRRDHYLCQARDEHGLKCGERARDVDHIVAGDNHSMSNLQALCPACHQRKTIDESREAREAKRARMDYREPHPGLIEG